MDGGDASSGMYRPCTEASEGQVLGESVESVGLGYQCGSIQEMDDSQLVGVPLAVSVEAAMVVKGEESPGAAALEIKPATVGPVEQVIETRKRGRPPKGKAPRPPPPKRNKEEEEEEDVCFICFDGGSLVLCDRKSCPKAYHPACIKRDESFFRSKAKWNCGWHICSVCQKGAHYMCYTCTYSLCKGCTKDAAYVCVRGNKGFCMTCMRTIMLIENKDTGNNEMIQVDFDDKTSWEYLFKVYWVYLKNKLSLTLNELMEAKNPWRGVLAVDFKQQSPDKNNFAKAGVVNIPDKSSAHVELKMPEEQPELLNQNPLSSEKLSNDLSTTSDGCTEWASRELLEFVGHMRNGDTSVVSQFDVQALLLDYIKKNNLRDPCRKSQIICDLRLKNLFGKPLVGHIEMLKLLEYHFLIKEDTQKNAFIPAGIVGGISNHVGVEQKNDLNSNQSKKRKTRKKGEERAPQTNLDEFAAIDVHNIILIYLRRNLMESLLGEQEKFHDKVVGSIVRIRVSCGDQKQDIYRLVQVVGTSKAAEPYKIGDTTVDMMLEVLNLDKKETISIDAISNQEFSEDECRRLRQSIKCGLVKRLTVGEIQIKAIVLQAVRLNDCLEAEILRLNHLRDRANEKGHKKELRECVEKLQLLKTPEERHRRLSEIPEVHADPKMNPKYESEDDAARDNDKKKDEFLSPRYSKFNVNGNRQVRPKRGVKDDGPVKMQQFGEKRDTGRLNSSAKHENQVVVCGLASRWSNQVVVRSASETSTATFSSGNSPSADNSEMEKMWHYRDPNGKIQGPFSMVQLRKWSTTGYFPGDLRIWTNNEQDDSVPLTDALNGQFHKASPLPYVAEGWHKFSGGTASESKQEGVLQFTDSRVGSNSNHEFARAEGSASLSSDWSKPIVDKEQPGNMQQFDLSRNRNSCSDHPQVRSPHRLLDLEQTCVAPVLPSRGHEVEEFNCVLDCGIGSSHETSMHQISGQQSHEKPSSSHISVGQSLGQNCRTLPLNLDLNQNDFNLGLISSTGQIDSSEQNGRTDPLDLPSSTPKTSMGNLEGLASEKQEPISVDVPAQASGVSDLPSPTPKPMDGDLPSLTPNLATEGLPSPTSKPTDEDQGGQITETKQSVPSKVSIQYSCPSWSKASSLTVGRPQLRERADEWGGYSPTHTKPSIEEWDSGLLPMSSLKPPEAVGDRVATPNLNSDQLTHSSPSHPASNVSGWQAVVNEPIEFSTLAEESVSDLLAEVDAMESQSGLASPTSGMKNSDERNDCFSSIEELSPTHDNGKSDALSSTADIQFPCQETVIDDPVGAPQADASDNLKRSGGHSTTSSDGETKSADETINPRETGSGVHPLVPCTMSQGMATATMSRGRGLEIMDTSWAAVQGNMNLGWGGPTQGFANIGWGPSVGTPWGNPNFNLGAYNGNVAWDDQRRYGGERLAGSRDWTFQGGDMGFGKGRPTWSRQSHSGGGGGYSRPSPKGQRVCKFYESGHCKKGASCHYLHP